MGLRSEGKQVIETLTSNDARVAVLLWEEANLTRPWNDSRADFLKAVTGPCSAVLGMREDGHLVGTAMVGYDGHRGWVYYLAVKPAYRGKGMGRQLMAGAETWLRQHGAPKVQFMVRSENAEVIEFYTHLGYIPQYVQVLGRRLD
jgi:ribosomal protein S18 acetylase RimI-like enzyme